MKHRTSCASVTATTSGAKPSGAGTSGARRIMKVWRTSLVPEVRPPEITPTAQGTREDVRRREGNQESVHRARRGKDMSHTRVVVVITPALDAEAA